MAAVGLPKGTRMIDFGTPAKGCAGQLGCTTSVSNTVQECLFSPVNGPTFPAEMRKGEIEIHLRSCVPMGVSDSSTKNVPVLYKKKWI